MKKPNKKEVLKALEALSQLVTMSDLAFSAQNVNAKMILKQCK